MSLLVTYSDSSGDENEDDNQQLLSNNNPRKRKIQESSKETRESDVDNRKPRKKLPGVPLDVQKMFCDESEESRLDDSEAHDGRVRSFAHERGNWASYVYIPGSSDEGMNDLAEALIDNLAAYVKLNMTDDFHLSLSRTFVLRHHWIDSFVATLKKQLSSCRRFVCEFGELEVYCNDEGTRTFLGFKVCTGHEKLLSLTKNVDACLEEFKLPKYYEEPSFHVSIAWALGDVTDILKSAKIQMIFKKFIAEEVDISPSLSILDVNTICCKVGNRLFTVPLVGR